MDDACVDVDTMPMQNRRSEEQFVFIKSQSHVTMLWNGRSSSVFVNVKKEFEFVRVHH